MSSTQFADIDKQIDAGFQWLNPSHDLLVSEMGRSNPIELLLFGLAAPLSIAVVLSGGELQLGSMLKVKLPPIGDGILKLRNALGPMNIPPLEVKPTRRRTAVDGREG